MDLVFRISRRSQIHTPDFPQPVLIERLGCGFGAKVDLVAFAIILAVLVVDLSAAVAVEVDGKDIFVFGEVVGVGEAVVGQAGDGGGDVGCVNLRYPGDGRVSRRVGWEEAAVVIVIPEQDNERPAGRLLSFHLSRICRRLSNPELSRCLQLLPASFGPCLLSLLARCAQETGEIGEDCDQIKRQSSRNLSIIDR